MREIIALWALQKYEQKYIQIVSNTGKASAGTVMTDRGSRIYAKPALNQSVYVTLCN